MLAILKQLKSRTIELSRNSDALLQEGVVDEIAGMLGIRVSSSARRVLAAGEATNPEAYRPYQEGLGHLRRFEEESIRRAIPLFQDAVARDPGVTLLP